MQLSNESGSAPYRQTGSWQRSNHLLPELDPAIGNGAGERVGGKGNPSKRRISGKGTSDVLDLTHSPIHFGLGLSEYGSIQSDGFFACYGIRRMTM
jgi:hypothetical protein